MQSDAVLNFSGGPGALPLEVLEQARDAVIRAPGTNQSVLGISHRSQWFKDVLKESEDNVRRLLNVPDNYHVLQLQGGSSLQFSMIPILLLRNSDKAAQYFRSGYWSKMSIPDAELEGRVDILFDGTADGFTRLPTADEITYSPDAAYFHYVSNETVEGLQFNYLPGLNSVPRICDMSSDMLSRPFDINRFDLIYAHAQKNLGPSGLTLVLIKDELLEQAPESIHSMLDYRNHIEMNSVYNTPPVFAIYVTMLVTRWLKDTVGGLAEMEKVNNKKAALLYECLDAHADFYRGHVEHKDRSVMNVAFTLPSKSLEAKFLEAAEQAGFYGLGGHRSLGGLRASLYNAVTEQDVHQLVDFMQTFRKTAG